MFAKIEFKDGYCLIHTPSGDQILREGQRVALNIEGDPTDYEAIYTGEFNGQPMFQSNHAPAGAARLTEIWPVLMPETQTE